MPIITATVVRNINQGDGSYTAVNFPDGSKNYYDRSLGFRPGFRAVPVGDERDGNIGRGRGGKRDYYFVTDKVTGDTQVVRKGQFGNDDVIGTVQQNGDGSSSFTTFKGSNGQNGIYGCSCNS